MLNSNPFFGIIKDIDKAKFQAIMDSPLTIKERIALLKYATKTNQITANKDSKKCNSNTNQLRTPSSNRLSKIPCSRSTTSTIQEISSPNSTMLDSFCTSSSKVSPDNSVGKFSPMNSSELFPMQPKRKVKLGSFSSPTYHLSSNRSNYKHESPRNDNKMRSSGIPIRKTSSGSKANKLNENKVDIKDNDNSIINHSEYNEFLLTESNLKFNIHRIPSIKELDPKLLVDEKSLVDWINNTLQLSISQIEDTANGAIACQLLDMIYPLVVVPMHKVNWLALEAFEAAANYKILLVCFKKLKIEHHEFIHDIISGIHNDNVNFMQWFKILFELNSPDISKYDCYGQRCKGLGGHLTWVAPKTKECISALSNTYNSVLDSIEYEEHSFIQERHTESYYEEENQEVVDNANNIIDNGTKQHVEISPIKKRSEAILLESSMQSINCTHLLMNVLDDEDDNDKDSPFTPNASLLHDISSNTNNENTQSGFKSSEHIEFDTSIHLQTIYVNFEENVMFQNYENAMLVQASNECYEKVDANHIKTICSFSDIATNEMEQLRTNDHNNSNALVSSITNKEEMIPDSSIIPSVAIATISKTNDFEISRNSDKLNYDIKENLTMKKVKNIPIGKYISFLLIILAAVIFKFDKYQNFKYSKYLSNYIESIHYSTTSIELRNEMNVENIIMILQEDLERLHYVEELETMKDQQTYETVTEDDNMINIATSNNDISNVSYTYVEPHQNLSIVNYLNFENNANISIINNTLEVFEDIETQVEVDQGLNNEIQVEMITNDDKTIHSKFISSIEESMQWLKVQLILVAIANVFGLIMIVYSIRMLCCITTSNHKITNLMLQSPNTYINNNSNNNTSTEESSMTISKRLTTNNRAKTPSRRLLNTNTTTTAYQTRSAFKVFNDDSVDRCYMHTRSKQPNPNGKQLHSNNNHNTTARTLWGAVSPARR